MHIECIDHAIARWAAIEGETKICPGQYNRLGALFLHHAPARSEEHVALCVRAYTGDGYILIRLPKVFNIVVASDGTGAMQLAVQPRTHDDACAEQANTSDTFIREIVVEWCHGGYEWQ